jgi:hypothetical protein
VPIVAFAEKLPSVKGVAKVSLEPKLPDFCNGANVRITPKFSMLKVVFALHLFFPKELKFALIKHLWAVLRFSILREH